jgi:hypothetical protein
LSATITPKGTGGTLGDRNVTANLWDAAEGAGRRWCSRRTDAFGFWRKTSSWYLAYRGLRRSVNL